jgi:hypothetical protein
MHSRWFLYQNTLLKGPEKNWCPRCDRPSFSFWLSQVHEKADACGDTNGYWKGVFKQIEQHGKEDTEYWVAYKAHPVRRQGLISYGYKEVGDDKFEIFFDKDPSGISILDCLMVEFLWEADQRRLIQKLKDERYERNRPKKQDCATDYTQVPMKLEGTK